MKQEGVVCAIPYDSNIIVIYRLDHELIMPAYNIRNNRGWKEKSKIPA